jgi:hypothetical protein
LTCFSNPIIRNFEFLHSIHIFPSIYSYVFHSSIFLAHLSSHITFNFSKKKKHHIPRAPGPALATDARRHVLHHMGRAHWMG